MNYPYIWDMPQHDRVQWNGSVFNLGAGALVRNIGEVLGVFGALDFNADLKKPAGHSHSVNMNGLATLEDYLFHLWSLG